MDEILCKSSASELEQEYNHSAIPQTKSSFVLLKSEKFSKTSSEDSVTSDSDQSIHSIPSPMSYIGPVVLDHGSRMNGYGKKRKTVEDYAAEHRFDLISRSIINSQDQVVRVLVCRFCSQSVGARSDRIKEHLTSKRHRNMKTKALHEASLETGRNLTFEEFSLSQFLPEPPANLNWMGKEEVIKRRRNSNGQSTSSQQNRPRPWASTSTHTATATATTPASFTVSSLSQFMQTQPQLSGINISAQASTSSSEKLPAYKKMKMGAYMTNDFEEDKLLRIKWGNHNTNLMAMFKTLRFNNQLIDISLWCEGKTVKCHKLVLAAGSTYFENLFKELNHPHPVIFLKDMPFWAVKAIVEFMYDGEVRVPQGRIPILVRAAESLQVQGLISDPNEDECSTSVGSSGVESNSPIAKVPPRKKTEMIQASRAVPIIPHVTIGQNYNNHHQNTEMQNDHQIQGQPEVANIINGNYSNGQDNVMGHYGNILNVLRDNLSFWMSQPMPQGFQYQPSRTIHFAGGSANNASSSNTGIQNLPITYLPPYVQVGMTTPVTPAPFPYTSSVQDGEDQYFDVSGETDNEEEESDDNLPESSLSNAEAVREDVFEGNGNGANGEINLQPTSRREPDSL